MLIWWWLHETELFLSLTSILSLSAQHLALFLELRGFSGNLHKMYFELGHTMHIRITFQIPFLIFTRSQRPKVATFSINKLGTFIDSVTTNLDHSQLESMLLFVILASPSFRLTGRLPCMPNLHRSPLSSPFCLEKSQQKKGGCLRRQ